MTLRVLMFLECNRCHAAFEQKFVASKIFHDDLRDEVHEMVLAAEAKCASECGSGIAFEFVAA